MIAVVLQTSFMHPPFGIALYNLRSVAPATVRTTQIYVGAIPFLAIQLLMVGILVVFPGLATTEQVQVRATEQEIEDALRPPPAESAPEPELFQPEKK
jgi:TRAP-type mannitol/chloroaromatic compound transport system permease large subunit